mgnify:CR=1 FL=1
MEDIMKYYNLGYACINTELSSRKVKVTLNSKMRRKTIDEKGPDQVPAIVLANRSELPTFPKLHAKHELNLHL